MKKNRGFTLIELLAVIIILGILIGLTTISVNKIKQKQEVENRKNTINSILTAAKAYVADHPEKLSLFDYNTYIPIFVNDLIDSNYLSLDQKKYKELIYDGGKLEDIDPIENPFSGIAECSGGGDRYYDKATFFFNDVCKSKLKDKNINLYNYNNEYYEYEKTKTYRAVHIERCKTPGGGYDPSKVEYFIYDMKADIDDLSYKGAYDGYINTSNYIKYSDCGCQSQGSASSEKMCVTIN